MKFTDEELSRILGEHDASHMCRGGGYQWSFNFWLESEILNVFSPMCCVNQAAYNEYSPSFAESIFIQAAEWFDSNYWPDWSVDELLAELEHEGLA